MIRAYWRRFVASVTGFAHRYRYEIFFRTGWNVILLQLGFTILLVALVLVALSLLYDDVLAKLISSVAQTIANGQISSPADNVFTAQDLEYAKQKNMVLASTGVLLLATIFGYLITRLALVPTKKALTSQKQFVGNIAHELRTPLSIIKTNTEVALFNTGLDTDTRSILTSNVEELDRISNIINNLLSINRLLRPEKVIFSNVDTGLIVEQVTSTLKELATRRQVTFSTRFSEWRTVWGNSSGVEQILMNVVKNAVSYSESSGTVSISIEPADHRTIAIIVADTGMGIHEEDLEHIFQPFYRGDRSRNRNSGGGSGLGLAIVSELVKLHKGRITVRSAPRKGTVVSIYLPEGRARGPERTADKERTEVAVDFST